MGGDEFGILLYGCPVPKAIKIADQIRQAIDDFRFIWEEHTFTLGVSIGLTEITPDSESLTSVINNADAACYEAKQQGRNCIKVSETHLV